jgi:threonyl-tRNA synthetase
MCRGPHVARTLELPDAFRLRSVAGAYWRGDEHRPMMTRIYAWCFENKQELEEQVAAHEARLANDHKRLGPSLDPESRDCRIERTTGWSGHTTMPRRSAPAAHRCERVS